MKVVWTTGARDSLRIVHSYIAASNPIAAKQVTRRIRHATDKLVMFPNIGRIGRLSNTRELVVSDLPFLIVYRVGEASVNILRVFHDKQLRM
jgi:toxin ParE1/3/4